MSWRMFQVSRNPIFLQILIIALVEPFLISLFKVILINHLKFKFKILILIFK